MGINLPRLEFTYCILVIKRSDINKFIFRPFKWAQTTGLLKSFKMGFLSIHVERGAC